MTRYGATLEEWQIWATLGLQSDLLPVVSNPNAEISPNSSLREIGKTPSVYNSEGKVIGFPQWTDYQATQDDLKAWSENPDYGICVQTRSVHAFDVDCDDKDEAKRVWETLGEGWRGAIRVRDNSPRFLVVFRPAIPFKPRKLINLGGGNKVEFYGIGKQFAACGTHPSGARYSWL